MYAIVDIAGQQFKVQKGQQIYVHRLTGNEGDKLEFGNVLLIDNEGKITSGSPLIDGARVAARIVSHEKGDKVIVFKKKRRKGYQKSNGHRQYLTKIQIQGILGKGESLKAEDEPAVKKAVVRPKKEASPAPETEAAAKPAKKTVAKKAAAEKEPKAAPKAKKAAGTETKKPSTRKKKEE